MLHLAQRQEVISFAGGLPNATLFPLSELKEITATVLNKYEFKALQYTTTEGFYPLRQLIAEIYNVKYSFAAEPENILITSGSQQGIDLAGKLFLDAHDHIVLEEPSYVGAIEAFAAYEPHMASIPLQQDGMDMEALQSYLDCNNPKLLYTVPTFQNPSGRTYSLEKRRALAELLDRHNVVLIEDDPYRELRFVGDDLPPISSLMKGAGLLLGSCSKIIVPGLRVGSIHAPVEIIEKLTTAKQAADVHSSILSQILIYEYLTNYDCMGHVKKVRDYYEINGKAMVAAIERYFPEGVNYTTPEGGMFIWVQLPEMCSSLSLFEKSIQKNVAFVPGDPFFIHSPNSNYFRLSYCNSTTEDIERGIRILGTVIREQLQETAMQGARRFYVN